MQKKIILEVLGKTGTVYILEYLSTHEKTQYKELNRTLACHTLNCRIRELLELNLIEHHFVKKETRTEWYTITEKGKRVVEHIQKLQKILELEN